jgi:hypothetical protein
LRGQRQRSAQVVTCPSCGRKRFVLPSNPWPRLDASAIFSSASTLQAAAAPRKLGRLVLVIVVGGAMAMGLLFLAVKAYLPRSPSTLEPTPAAGIRAHIEAGQHALREEAFRLALKELNAASAQRDRHPDALSREENRQLNQLRRQSDLLAHLLDLSLEEILRLAMQHRHDDEWREKFEDYRGRTVLFDDILRQDPQGRPILDMWVRVDEVRARVALEDLPLLRQLPLDPPRRWLFGARLANCQREAGGVWVIRFTPDTAVLLTDEDAAAACYPGPMDAELRAVLRRQDDWLRR